MHCGLDFGTSNSTIGATREGRTALLPLEGGQVTMPSALFYHEDRAAPAFGREAVATYLDGGYGRLFRSIKSVLGTSLVDEKTQVGTRQVPLKSVIADFIGELKRRAEARLGTEVDAIVQGRPVRFVGGGDSPNRRAEDTLREILSAAGFRHIRFQLEPIAAARHFESQATTAQLALVADIGGGTSDFSVVRIDPGRRSVAERHDDVLGNHGIRLGGTDFDHTLNFSRVTPLFGRGALLEKANLVAPQWIYADLASWARMNLLYGRKAMRDIRWAIASGGGDIRFRRLEKVIDERLGHHIAADVERAKIALSDGEAVDVDLGYVEGGLRRELTLSDLRDALAHSLEKLERAIKECLRQGGVGRDAIEVVILTGGSTEMPLVRDVIARTLPEASLAPCDKFGAVGSGLALEARATFGDGPHPNRRASS